MNKPKSNPLGKSQFIRIGLGAAGLGIVYLVFALWGGNPYSKILPIFIDLLLCAGGLAFWLFFFAQFILPVRKRKEREQASERLFDYLSGYHGPALFIESGELRERKYENQRKGPGLIWLDTASAALLRTPTRYTRAVGPGIVFTARNEYVGGTVDLHVQSSRLGPKEDEDAFIPRLKRETKEDYEARLQRRFDTQAITRDSHEIVSNISVSFRLDANDGEGGTQFGYRAVSLERAISGRPIDASDGEESKEKAANWQYLPVHLAANIWRETLTKFTLSELFENSEEASQGVLQFIVQHVKDRLQKEMVVSLDEYGKPVYQKDARGNLLKSRDGKPIPLLVPSREYKVLQSRGLRVTGTNIFNLHFQPEVEKELLNGWKTTWLDRARREREAVEKRRNYASEEGRQEAVIDFSNAVSQELGAHTVEENLDGREILKLLIQGNLELCQGNPLLIPLTAEDVNHLRELQEWLEKGPDQP